jgi:type III secretory pathway component EscR
MKRCFVFALLLTLTVFLAQPVFSQTTEELKTLKEEIKSLKEGQSAIQKDLQEIKKLLASRPAAKSAEFKEAIINIEGAPSKGEKTAKLALMEFSDYQ